MVLVTTAVGVVLASPVEIAWATLLVTVLGTALAAASANILNQLIEIDRDRLMRRTASRPLPCGAIRPITALTLAVICGWSGVMILGTWTNPLAASLALATILLYAFVYTPLKTRTTLNTLVGAVTGAIPPMIGWAAVTGELGIGAWVLGAVLFVWQLPHFLALAWMYRDDYRRGGFVMLPLHDPSGRLTAEVALMTALLLVPVGLLAFLTGLAGPFFAIGSVLLGAYLVALAIRLARRPTDANARSVFLASIIYLPLLLGLMVLDRGPILRPIEPAPEAVAAVSASVPDASQPVPFGHTPPMADAAGLP